jgi:hypothetical protein
MQVCVLGNPERTLVVHFTIGAMWLVVGAKKYLTQKISIKGIVIRIAMVVKSEITPLRSFNIFFLIIITKVIRNSLEIRK